jgi:Ran GTPase-activating protein (RanGAP) involved in mRNA processing and transport
MPRNPNCVALKPQNIIQYLDNPSSSKGMEESLAKLEDIKFDFDNAVPNEMINIIRILGHCSSIKHLSIIDSKIEHDDLKTLLNVVRNIKTLKSLNLGGDNIEVKGVGLVADGVLKPDSSILSLDLSFNKITQKGVERIAKVLNSTNLERLNLSGNLLKKMKWAPLFKALETNTKLLSLDLTGTNVGDTVVSKLTKVLNLNSTLKELNLSKNDIGDKGLASLALALEHNQVLKKLFLSCNYFGLDAMDKLTNALKSNKKLEELYLNSNFILLHEADDLAECLKINRSLKVLDLSDNLIGPSGAKILASVLNCTGVVRLNLSDNAIENDGVVAICKALQKKSSIIELDLGSNSISDEGAKAVAAMLLTNNTLKALSIACNFVRDEAVSALAEVLKSGNHTLRFLHLGYNKITEEGLKTISEMIARNTTLEEFDLRQEGIEVKWLGPLVDKLNLNTALRKFHLNYDLKWPDGTDEDNLNLNNKLRQKVQSILDRNKTSTIKLTNALRKTCLMNNLKDDFIMKKACGESNIKISFTEFYQWGVEELFKQMGLNAIKIRFNDTVTNLSDGSKKIVKGQFCLDDLTTLDTGSFLTPQEIIRMKLAFLTRESCEEIKALQQNNEAAGQCPNHIDEIKVSGNMDDYIPYAA